MPGIGGVGPGEEAVSPADHDPVLVGDPARVEGGVRGAPDPVILKAAIDAIGSVQVEAHLVDLGGVDALDRLPGFPAVVGNVDPAVVAVDEMGRVRGVDPEPVVVRVDARPDGPELLAAVVRYEKARRQDIDRPVVRGIDVDLAVVERSRIDPPERRGIAGPFPAVPVVLRPPDPAVVVLDEGIDDAGLAPGHGQSDAARCACGQVLRQPLPGHPAVARAVDPAPRPPARINIG